MKISIRRALTVTRQIVAIPFFAMGMVCLGLWSIITGKE